MKSNLTNLKKLKELNQALKEGEVCLFWCSSDWSEVIRKEGCVKFDNNDLSISLNIEPKGNHNDHNRDSENYNRGRVVVYQGKIYIGIGYTCPEKNYDIIKQQLGLKGFNIEKYKPSVMFDSLFPSIEEENIDDYPNFDKLEFEDDEY